MKKFILVLLASLMMGTAFASGGLNSPYCFKDILGNYHCPPGAQAQWRRHLARLRQARQLYMDTLNQFIHSGCVSEYEVADLIEKGYTYKQIADYLVNSHQCSVK